MLYESKKIFSGCVNKSVIKTKLVNPLLRISYTPRKKFLWFKQICALQYGQRKHSVIQTNLYIAIPPKKSFFDSNKSVYCYTVKEKILWFKQNFFESNKSMHCYTAKEKFHWFKQICVLLYGQRIDSLIQSKFLWIKQICALLYRQRKVSLI